MLRLIRIQNCRCDFQGISSCLNVVHAHDVGAFHYRDDRRCQTGMEALVYIAVYYLSQNGFPRKSNRIGQPNSVRLCKLFNEPGCAWFVFQNQSPGPARSGLRRCRHFLLPFCVVSKSFSLPQRHLHIADLSAWSAVSPAYA